MTEQHYIVSRQHAAWQYAFRGHIAAPFSSQVEATEAAIAEAKESGDQNAKVIVQHADMQEEIVWHHES